MGTTKFKLGMDNRIQPGITTQQEVIATLQAQGINPGAANPVFDLVTGKLIQVDLTLPEESADKAAAAIAAHGGVVGSPGGLLSPLFILDLTNIALATVILDAVVQGVDGQIIRITAIASDLSKPNQNLGDLGGNGTANTYVDFGNNNDPTFQDHTLMQITHRGSADFSIPANDLTITADGNALLVAALAPLVVKAAAPSFSQKFWWIDSAGKLYLAGETVAGSTVLPTRDYATSVAAGAV